CQCILCFRPLPHLSMGPASGRASRVQRRAMAKPSQSETPSLADLRRGFARIDESMHGLLMERGEIIDRLISVKQTQETGSAFRPAREAEMMRRLGDRHKAITPLHTA